MPSFNAPAALQIWLDSKLDIPFIVVTGTIGEEKAVQLMKFGAHDFVLKHNLKRLIPAIERELREAVNRRAKREVENERIRLLQELQEAVRVRDDFLSVASHELKTPLTPLKVRFQLLMRILDQDPLPAEQIRSMVATFGKQIDRLTRLADQLLDVSRIRSGRLELELAEVDVTQLVSELVDQLRAQIAEAQCLVEVQAHRNVMAQIDAPRIREVILNLLANALKYGPCKPIRVTLDSDGKTAVVSVQDFGIGIAKEDQVRIFERFERAVPIDNYGGLGLGLYISRQILWAHGGSIRVESELQRGATFTIEIPIKKS